MKRPYSKKSFIFLAFISLIFSIGSITKSHGNLLLSPNLPSEETSIRYSRYISVNPTNSPEFDPSTDGTPIPIVETNQTPEKDTWDKIDSISGLISGILVALIGGIAALIYKKRERLALENRTKKELALIELQATQGFFPYLLSENEKEKEMAILAISELGSPRMAKQLASIVKSAGARKAVSVILSTPVKHPLIQDYVFENMQISHDINPNGDCLYERLVEVRSILEPVYWVQFSVSTVGGNPEKGANELGIQVLEPNSKAALSWTIEQDTPTNKSILVPLNPPAIKGNNKSVLMKLKWKGAYSPLVNELTDSGYISLDHEVTYFQLSLYAPRNLLFSDIVFSSNIFKVKIQSSNEGRSLARITAQDIPVGKYEYKIKCTKRNET